MLPDPGDAADAGRFGLSAAPDATAYGGGYRSTRVNEKAYRLAR